MTLAPLCSVMRTMRPQSVRNSHTFVSAMKTTNGKCKNGKNEDQRGHKDNVITRNTNPMPKPATVAGSAVGYDATSPLAALPLLAFLRQPRFDFLSLYLCAKRTEFSNTPRIVGGQSPILCLSLPISLSLSLSSPLCLPRCCTPPFIHGLRFRLMRCEFIAKCNTRCLLSFPLSLSLFLTSALSD